MAMPDNINQVVIRDLKLEMSAGIYEHEKVKYQSVIVNVKLDVFTNLNASLENIEEVVSYEDIIKQIEKLAVKQHYNLLERFAEDIARMCLNFDNKIQAAEVSVEKPDIIENVTSVGIHIKRHR
jgi:FolB domain-containing protein